MLILIKKRYVYTTTIQGNFKDKKAINYMQNNLPVICHLMHCFWEGSTPPMLDILKRHFNNFKDDSDHIHFVIVKYSLYSHTTGDISCTII